MRVRGALGAAALTLPLLVGVAPAARATTDPVIAAAGDIACDPNNPNYNNGAGQPGFCQQQATSNLLVNSDGTQKYSAVLPLGDNQYDTGALSAYQQVYDPTWGRTNPVTHPVPGNHEYPDPSGYFSYFGAAAGAAGQGWYSYDVGSWHLIALNSNCAAISGGCGPGSPEETWLHNDLAAHSNACVLAYWHHPLFSSGQDGYNSITLPFWQDLYAYGADIVLNGHAHEYERFAPQKPNGAVDTSFGITEIVDGTGGEDFEPSGTQAPNSLVLQDGIFGVVELTLHPTSADFHFVDIANSFSDSGTVACHGAPPSSPPSTPTAVDGTRGDGQVTVSWTPSTGQPASYTVTAAPGGATTTVSAGQATAVVSGLTDGTAYTFTVTASNAAGSSPASSPSRSITPRAAPVSGDYASQVLRDAPAGYWQFGESSTSSAVADASGNGRAGSYSGGITLGQPGATAGGSSALFDGSSGQAVIPDASPLRLNGAFTIEFWAKLSSFANTWPGVIRKGSAGGADGYLVWYTSNGTLHFKRNNFDLATPAGALTADSFHHFVVSYDGTVARWYVNGAQVASKTLAIPLSVGTSALTLGRGDNFGNQWVDDVAVYNSALPASRVAAHYSAAQVVVTVPGAPTNVSATAGNASASVSWAAPSSDGGSPITSYVVRASNGATATVNGSTFSTTVNGLTNGTSYTFTVAAVNSAGTGPASAPSNAVTPTAPISSNYLNAVLADQPIGYWRLGEKSGTAAADSSGNGNVGSYVGGYTLAQPGALPTDTDTSVLYNGSTGLTVVPDSAALRLNGPFTIELWAKESSFMNTWPGLLRKGTAGSADGYLIWYTSDGTLHFKRNNFDVATPAGALSTSAWHYFVVTYDGTTLQWYIDGKAGPKKTLAIPTNNGTAALTIGKGDNYGNEWIDDVAFYSTALSAARISAHYGAATG